MAKIASQKLGALVDALYLLDEQISRRNAETRKLGAKYSALEATIMKRLPSSDLSGIEGKRAAARFTRTVVGNVTSWPAVYKYIKQRGAFELLQRRINNAAYREYLENKIKVPGVERFINVKLSLRKLGKS